MCGACGDASEPLVHGEWRGDGVFETPSLVNTSPDGGVRTIIGGLLDTRSTRPILHIYKKEFPDGGESVTLQHYVYTEDHQTVELEVRYLEGRESFPLLERGGLAIRTPGEGVLIAQEGTVTVTPMQGELIRMELAGLSLLRFTDAGDRVTDQALTIVGDGVIEGPVERRCTTEEVRRATPPGGDESTTTAGQAAAIDRSVALDGAWVGEFCTD